MTKATFNLSPPQLFFHQTFLGYIESLPDDEAQPLHPSSLFPNGETQTIRLALSITNIIYYVLFNIEEKDDKCEINTKLQVNELRKISRL